MTVGLTLGKYAPLHRGHEFVFETALDEVDHLIVLVYDCPSVTSVPLSVRADWIRSGYPTVEVIEGWAMPTGRAYGDRDDERTHEQAIVDRLDGRDVDVFYSSEPYGGHVSDALDATDRRVDPERETVPISSTTIREATFEHRAFVPDRVYRDLITNVALLGGPSTGKTTLARHLAETFDTEWMPEYGREYWMDNQVDGILTSAQLVDLAEGHLEREDE
ncbi:MAG: AAA family ATPase, partial [Halococcoides sp.]